MSDTTQQPDPQPDQQPQPDPNPQTPDDTQTTPPPADASHPAEDTVLPTITEDVGHANVPQPTAPATPAADEGTVLVQMAGFAGSAFESGVEGVPPIGTNPTAIPANSLDAVLEAAKGSGVTVRQTAHGGADQ